MLISYSSVLTWLLVLLFTNIGYIEPSAGYRIGFQEKIVEIKLAGRSTQYSLWSVKRLVKDIPLLTTQEFWIADTQKLTVNKITPDKEYFDLPIISPNGRYIVVLSGLGRFDAGCTDRSVKIIEVDKDYHALHIWPLHEFEGILSNDCSIYPLTNNSGDGGQAIEFVYRWENDALFDITLARLGIPPDGVGVGIYRLDVVHKKAWLMTKIKMWEQQ